MADNASVITEEKPLFMWRWVLALCFTALGTTTFTEIQSQWFKSYVKISEGDIFGASILVAVSAVLGTIFYLVFGTISDTIRTRYGRRVPLYVTGAFVTACLMLLFILTTNFIILLILGGVLIATTVSLCHVANKGLIPDLVQQRRRGRINIILFVMGNSLQCLCGFPLLFYYPAEGNHIPWRYIKYLYIKRLNLEK